MKKLYTLLAFVSISASINAQTNLIANEGFELWTAGAPNSWFTTGTVTTQGSGANVHSGTSSCGITAPAPTGTATSANKTISPTTDIPATQGVTYVFSGWFLDNSPTAQFKYWNQFRTIAGTTGADTGANALQSATYSTDSPQWIFFTTEGLPNATSTVARPGLRVNGTTTANGGIVYVDDIKFYDKSTLSVNANEFDNQIKMATVITDALSIQMPSRATVNIYSIDGKLFSSNRVNSNEEINTQSLAAGIYVVTIQNDYAKASRKIIKK